MATFELDKKFDDIQEAELLPEDWYVMVISAEPEVAANKKKKEGGEGAEGAGDNIVVKLRVEHSNQAFNKRLFTIWLPLPNPGDKEAFTGGGQPMEDFKMQRIAQVVEAFTGKAKGKKFNLSEGMTAKFYVIQGEYQGERRNEIDLFNNPPQPAGKSGSFL